MTFNIRSGIATPPGAAAIDFAGVSPVLPAAGAFKDLTDRLATPLTGAISVKARIAFRTLYQAGLLNTLDVFAGGLMSEADSLLNWISANYTAVKGAGGAAPVWDMVNGWTADGVDDTISTTFVPGGAGSHYALASASISVLVTDTGPNATTYVIGSPIAGSYSRILARGGTQGNGTPNTVNGRLNNATSMTTSNAPASGVGVWTINRVDNAKARLLFNGTLVREEAISATDLPTAALALFRDSSVYMAGKAKAWAIGAGLTPSQEVAMAAALTALR